MPVGNRKRKNVQMSGSVALLLSDASGTWYLELAHTIISHGSSMGKSAGFTVDPGISHLCALEQKVLGTLEPGLPFLIS